MSTRINADNNSSMQLLAAALISVVPAIIALLAR
jgi:hypothetical protein